MRSDIRLRLSRFHDCMSLVERKIAEDKNEDNQDSKNEGKHEKDNGKEEGDKGEGKEIQN